MKIKDPNGQTWRVTRRWVPWRRRLKGAVDMMPDPPRGDDPISMVVTVIILIICLPVLILALVASLEFLLILLVLPFAVLARVVFGQHSTIDASRLRALLGGVGRWLARERPSHPGRGHRDPTWAPAAAEPA